MSRTLHSVKNVKYALIGQSIGLVVSFFARMIFVRTLGAEYLGINGLFSNILSMLSVAELGVGTAIVYSMYKPLVDKDYDKINSLMILYKNTYYAIGTFITIAGISITPYLGYLIRDMPSISNIELIYILFVMNSSITYFFSYKRSLIIADQKRYIATFYRYSFSLF
jgi:O-antigen/teichoic acid export membrane protein